MQADSSPVMRCQPLKRLEGYSTPTACRSPVITRSRKHGEIPFEIPPTMNSRWIESLQIQSDVTGLRLTSPSHRSISGSQNNLNMSEDRISIGSCTESNSIKGSPLQTSLPSSLVFSPRPDVSTRQPFTFSSDKFRSNELGEIQPELYKYSERHEIDLPRSRCGRIWFSLVYDGAIESLTVKVIKVKQLISRSQGNVPRDSFVKIFLLPGERISQQTKIRQRTNNPLFNETFVFQVSEEDIKERCLRLSVYDVDKRKSTRHLIGHALVSLNDSDPFKADEVLWRDLDDIAHPGDTEASLGELHISLCYSPSLDRLTVVIINAKNLRQIDLEETGIYVKVGLLQGHHVLKTKKTAILDGVSDPEFHESFSFKVSAKTMQQTCLNINVITTGGKGTLYKVTSTIKHTITGGRYESEHKYGRLTVGSEMYCKCDQLLHWQEMMENSSRVISKWHALSGVVSNH